MSTLDAKAAASEGAMGEPMKYKTVPAMPDLAFSAVGFGCWGISGGSTWNGSTDEESIRTVRTAVDLGITYFDVAPVYGFGHAEEVLGEALARRRDSVLIGSKCGLLWDDSGAIRNDLSSASIGKEIDESLRRLNTDHLDLYQMHWPDIATPIEESMEALERVVAAGKVRYIGVTNFSVERTDACRAIGPVAAHQGLYNMLEHNPTSYHEIPLEYRTRSEILPMVMREGMAFFPYSPLFQGLLTDAFSRTGNFDENDVRAANPKLNGEAFDAYYEAAQRLRRLAGELGRPLNQFAINWLASQAAVTSVIAGGQTPEHVTANAAAVTWDVTAEVFDRVDGILAPYAERGLI